jgi:hypothetical protein
MHGKDAAIPPKACGAVRTDVEQNAPAYCGTREAREDLAMRRVVPMVFLVVLLSGCERAPKSVHSDKAQPLATVSSASENDAEADAVKEHFEWILKQQAETKIRELEGEKEEFTAVSKLRLEATALRFEVGTLFQEETSRQLDTIPTGGTSLETHWQDIRDRMAFHKNMALLAVDHLFQNKILLVKAKRAEGDVDYAFQKCAELKKMIAQDKKILQAKKNTHIWARKIWDEYTEMENRIEKQLRQCQEAIAKGRPSERLEKEIKEIETNRLAEVNVLRRKKLEGDKELERKKEQERLAAEQRAKAEQAEQERKKAEQEKRVTEQENRKARLQAIAAVRRDLANLEDKIKAKEKECGEKLAETKEYAEIQQPLLDAENRLAEARADRRPADVREKIAREITKARRSLRDWVDAAVAKDPAVKALKEQRKQMESRLTGL